MTCVMVTRRHLLVSHSFYFRIVHQLKSKIQVKKSESQVKYSLGGTQRWYQPVEYEFRILKVVSNDRMPNESKLPDKVPVPLKYMAHHWHY